MLQLVVKRVSFIIYLAIASNWAKVDQQCPCNVFVCGEITDPHCSVANHRLINTLAKCEAI